MTNEEIMKIALTQSARDMNCQATDFLLSENKIVLSKANPLARAYLPLPFECDFVSYGNNIVAQVSERMKDTVTWYLAQFPFVDCFETPNLLVLNECLAKFDYQVCFMAEYFLPDMNVLKEIPCRYETRVLYPKDFQNYYQPQWSNALCLERKQLDVLAVGAFEDNRLIGLAGCSKDCETMYQIGVDVLADYRQQGIAAALTTKLALEIIKLGKVPFYCAAWSNVKSVRNAIKCGFRPAWVEVTARDRAFVAKMNKTKTEKIA